ncbi:unnamed protein product [Prorocentrum cordatum]|uniref:Uncharacterized protein n=1 Tax=Prorocentrum cordatum TaxID=2364126 RepID=A0ABN9T012_9DINO|nr:unnamed protein product [Polarella glacialis]
MAAELGGDASPAELPLDGDLDEACGADPGGGAEQRLETGRPGGWRLGMALPLATATQVACRSVVDFMSVFYTAYVTIREYVRDNGDLMTIEELGPLAEGFVTLAQKMLGSDVKVQEKVVFYAQQDLLRTGAGYEMNTADTTADIIQSVGLRECLTNIGYAAQEHPGVRFNVMAIASLAKAMAEANIVNKALSTKVAKAVIADADKLRPPDIGKLFVALHEKKWFTDPMAEGYLTESLVAQIQNLKKQDQGLDQIVQQSVKEQEAAAAA